MDDERKPVELVRIPREEEYYDREQIFGRDVSSVFPNQAQDGDALDAIKEAIGAKKFISETELDALKAARGLTVEDGTLAADKPLAEVLREAKEAKEAAFQDKWRLMKQGKNRPLDEEELAFFDHLYEAERAQMEAQAAEEAEALAAYRAAVATARRRQPGEEDGNGDGGIASTAAAAAAAVRDDDDAGFDALETSVRNQQQQQRQAKAAASSSGTGAAGVAGAKRAPLSALVKVRPKATPPASQVGAQRQAQQQQTSVASPGQQEKRQRLESVGQQRQQEDKEVSGEQGLAGLLGYGSDEDSGSQ